jgi:hypothetical protein
MILRRVIAHFRKQEWTAIFLDFVIVVAGVFMGIQVQQWNNERADRARERIYLQRVLADVELSIETTAQSTERLKAYSAGQKLVVESLRACSLPDAQKDAFADGVSDIAKIGPSVFVLNTMQEMLSAGNFSIIRNSAIRDILNGLERDAQYQANVFNAIYLQSASLMGTAGTRVTRIYPDSKTPFDPVGWSDIEIDFDALCKDVAFRAAVSNIRYLADASISLNQRAIDKLVAAKTALESEIGISPPPKGATP